MTVHNSSASSLGAEDEIDLHALVSTLWEKRVLIVLATFLGLAGSSVYALFIAKPVYQSSALLLPTQSPSSDQLGAAASLFGKKNSGNGDLELYQSLLTSRTVMHQLLTAPIANNSDTGYGKLQPLFSVLGIDTAKPIAVATVIEGLSGSITVGSKESGAGSILEVKTSAQSPWLAQQLGNRVLAIGQEELRMIRAERANIILPRLAEASDQAKAEWDSAARKTAFFRDQNRSIVLPGQILTLSRLEMERSTKEQKYLLARKEYEQQLLEKVKATPPMMILDSSDLPAKKIKPNKSLIVTIGFLGSLFLSSGLAFALKAISS